MPPHAIVSCIASVPGKGRIASRANVALNRQPGLCVISRTDPDELVRFGGTSFADMLSFSCRILDEDERFYFELMQNPSFKIAIEAFRTGTRGLIGAIERNDFEGFKSFF